MDICGTKMAKVWEEVKNLRTRMSFLYIIIEHLSIYLDPVRITYAHCRIFLNCTGVIITGRMSEDRLTKKKKVSA